MSLINHAVQNTFVFIITELLDESFLWKSLFKCDFWPESDKDSAGRRALKKNVVIQ